MTKRRLLALLLALVMAFTLAACSKTDNPGDSPTPSDGDKPDDKVLVIGVPAAFDAKWNPFLAETHYDIQVMEQIFTPICVLNDDGVLEPYAGSITYELQDNGYVLYTVKIQDGMFYTDGTPVTIDDFIYGIYVRSDPSYTGPNSMLASDIEGVAEYFYDNPNYSADLKAIEEEAVKYTAENISLEDFMIYAAETALDGWWNGDPAGDIGNGMTWSEYAEAVGYAEDLGTIDAASAEEMFGLIAKIEYETSLDAYDTHTWFLEKMKSDYALGNLSGGVNVEEISGINKIDDLTCTVLLTVTDIYGDIGLTEKMGTGNLIPRHYYGEITKGDVSSILSNMNPLGSGPYIFESFENNIVTCTANENFFLGVPKTGTVRWQSIPNTDVVEALVSGQVDITEPATRQEYIDEFKENPNIRYDLYENAGYGYMAMNTQNVSLNARKAVWSLMNRQPSIEGYFGTERAKIIERPMTTILPEYPSDAEPYYEYSRDAALEYFAQAGYTQKDGVLVNEAGEKFIINCFIGGQGVGDHPAYAMLVQAAEDLAALGGEIQIQDVNMNVTMAAVEDGTADMWIMAWSAVNTCDKTTQFHSTGGQNRYNYSSPKMDELLNQIKQTFDLAERSALVSEMLDLAMEDCIEFPLYQRMNMFAYNGDNIELDTVPAATPYASYVNVLWQIAVK